MSKIKITPSSQKFNTKFFCQKEKDRQGKDYYCNFSSGFVHYPHFFGEGPYFSVTIQETQESQDSYWAWKSFERQEYDYIYTARQLVDMCFPYGSAVEVERGSGIIVTVSLHDIVQLTDEEVLKYSTPKNN